MGNSIGLLGAHKYKGGNYIFKENYITLVDGRRVYNQPQEPVTCRAQDIWMNVPIEEFASLKEGYRSKGMLNE